MWCLVVIEPPETDALEGVTLLVTLINNEGDLVDQTIAYSPLNLLRPDQRMPIAVFFSNPPDEPLFAVATPISAVNAPTSEMRYTDVTLTLSSSEPGSDRLSWRVQGEIDIGPEDPEQLAFVRFLVVAYDSGGEIIGYRKWESPIEEAAGETRSFDVMVFSLGPPIERIDFLTEAMLVP
jgi:hypothetical protein